MESLQFSVPHKYNWGPLLNTSKTRIYGTSLLPTLRFSTRVYQYFVMSISAHSPYKHPAKLIAYCHNKSFGKNYY